MRDFGEESKEQLKRFCKNKRFRTDKRTKKHCTQFECTCASGSLEVFPFTARIGPAACNGRCAGTGFNDVTLYTTTPLVPHGPLAVLGPPQGAIVYYDAELTMPIVVLAVDDFIRITDCNFADVSEIGEILYVVC